MDTQNEVAERYGPQTVEVEALLERVRNLTGDETEALRDAWVTARAAAWVAARDATRAAAWVAGRRAARDAAWNVARAAARAAAWDAARVAAWAAWDAVQALLVRDLIGQHGFTQEHYDAFVAPWESVMGTEWTRETL